MKKQAFILMALAAGMFAAPACATAQTVVIEDHACKLMVRHRPAPGVAYQPGVDVHGRPVVEADLNPSPIAAPETVQFPLSVDVAQYAGIDVPAGTEAHATLGMVEIAPDGSMTFNGQPMEGEAEAALRALCVEKQARKPQKPQKPMLQKPHETNYNR